MIAHLTQQQIEAAVAQIARSFVDTPFRHQGRNPRTGLDCAGIGVCAYRLAGVDIIEHPAYRALPKEWDLEGPLRENGFEQTTILGAGRVVQFAHPSERLKVHIGVLVSPREFVHVLQNSKVHVESLSGRWGELHRATWERRVV